MDVDDRYPIAAGILRHVEIGNHLHFKRLALFSSWRLECEVSNIIKHGRKHPLCMRFGIRGVFPASRHKGSIDSASAALICVLPSTELDLNWGSLKAIS